MKKRGKKEKEKEEGIGKVLVNEIKESVFLEVAAEIILFVPKMIIRIIRNY